MSLGPNSSGPSLCLASCFIATPVLDKDSKTKLKNSSENFFFLSFSDRNSPQNIYMDYFFISQSALQFADFFVKLAF